MCDHTYSKFPDEESNTTPCPDFVSGKSEEEGVAGKEEALDPARESVTKPELTPDQRTFLIMMKTKNTSYNDILVEWTKQFARKPPSRKTVFRV